MPLSLPPELRNRLLASFEGPDAKAFRLVKLVEFLKWEPHRWPAFFRKSWEQFAAHQRVYLMWRLGTYQSDSWDDTNNDVEMVQQWLAFNQEQIEGTPGNPKRSMKFSQLMDSFYFRHRGASGTEKPVESMKGLISEVQQTLNDSGSVEERGDLVHLLLMCMESLSTFYEKSDKIEKAVTQANRAVKLAQEFNRTDQVTENRCRSARLLFIGSRNIDQALVSVLPVWERVQNGSPSLARATLAYTLANGYAQTGDRTEASYFMDKTAEDLQSIGLGFEVDDPVKVFTSWLDSLPVLKPEGDYTLKRLTAAAMLHGQYATLQRKAVKLPNGNAFWEARQLLCVDMVKKCYELQTYQELVDERLVNGEPVPEFSTWNIDSFNTAADLFNQWLTATYDQFEVSSQREEFCGELYDKLEEDVVRKDIINQMLVWQVIAEFHTQRGEIRKAAEALESAYQRATEAKRLNAQLQILNSLVYAYEGGKHAAERLEVCRRAIDLIEGARAAITTPYQRSAFVQDKYHFYALALHECWKNRDPELMLGIMELVKARGYRDALLRDGKEAAELREQLNALHEETLSAKPGSLPAITRQRQILYDTRLLRARRERAPSDYLSVSFQRIIESLPEGEAVLNYCELIGGIWVCQLVVGGQSYSQRLKVDEAWLHEHIATYGGDLPSGYRGRGMTIYKPKYGGSQRDKRRAKQKALAEWLLPAEFREALVGCRHLRVCPHHELHGVPFHALPYADGYLIEQFAVSYLPNLNCLPLPPRKRNKSDAPVALIGTDRFARIDGQELAPLPGALGEVNELAAFYEADQVPVLNFTGTAARRDKILDPSAVQALEDCRVVHLAVHGEDLSPESPMDARLFLRDGFIDGFDISLMRLTAEVVVLSACFAGARPQAVRGYEELVADDMFGLQSAFFSAGAQSVLGALWPVEDEAGKLLMVDFHRHLREHGAAEALRLATLAYLRSAPEKRRGSVYWGGFFLVVG